MARLKRWIGIDQGCTKRLMTAQVEGGYIDKTVPTGMEVTPEYLSREIMPLSTDCRTGRRGLVWLPSGWWKGIRLPAATCGP